MNSNRAIASEFHELVLNATPHAIIALDTDGRILFANDNAAELVGVEQNDLIGSAQHEALGHAAQDGGKFAQSDCPICLALQNASHLRTNDCSFTNGLGGQFPVELELTPISTAASPIRAVMSFSDLTQRLAVLQQNVQSQKLQSIGELASGIAHEINTPIQYINDNLYFLQNSFSDLRELLHRNQELLRNLGSDELNTLYDRALETLDVAYLVQEIPEAISQAIEGTGRVATIVRAMKEFAHPAEASMAPIDLNRVIRSSITVARNEWKYVAEIDEQLDETIAMVPCLGSEMHQVILNLIINAAHAVAEKVGGGQEKGSIAISTHEENEDAVIRISDTGLGIPEEVRPRIFDPFFTTKSVGKGTGQGLAIAHSVVTKHGGTIHFETELGRGTTFIIRLPLTVTGGTDNLNRNHGHEACAVC